MSEEKKKDEKPKYHYSLREIRMVQRDKLKDLGIPESEIEKIRENTIKMGKDLLMTISNDFKALATKLSIIEMISKDDLLKIYKKLTLKIPVKVDNETLTVEDLPDIIQFLTPSIEEEMSMIMMVGK